jgi:hypothetical protein
LVSICICFAFTSSVRFSAKFYEVWTDKNWFNFQLHLQAVDGGPDPNYAKADVEISVDRNLLPPTFSLPPSASRYVVNVEETKPVGTEILTVSATDLDPKVF